MEHTLVWGFVENPPGYSEPKWKRSAALSDDGRVFVPAIIAGNESRVFLCAAHDGEHAIYEDGHLFVPSDWLAREFPVTSEVCEKIERRVKAGFDA